MERETLREKIWKRSREVVYGVLIGLFIVFLLLFLTGIFISFTSKEPAQPGNIVENGSYLDIPIIGKSSDYGKDFKTYTSSLGFSFSYPSHLKVTDLLSHIVLRPVNEESDNEYIVVSVGLNDENMTAEEWLLSPNSGYLQSKDNYGNYYKTTIDGQDAVYTDGGMWTVVNTPDNKYRLSIADVPSESNDRLFTEMGIVTESFVFNR